MARLPCFCGHMWADIRVHGYNFCRCEQEAKSTKDSVSKERSGYEEFSAELCCMWVKQDWLYCASFWTIHSIVFSQTIYRLNWNTDWWDKGVEYKQSCGVFYCTSKTCRSDSYLTLPYNPLHCFVVFLWPFCFHLTQCSSQVWDIMCKRMPKRSTGKSGE